MSRLDRNRGEPSLLRLTICFGLLAPLVAWAGVATFDADALPGGPAAPPAPRAPAATMQIRCWQEGRLLFEENGIQFRDGSRYNAVVAGSDREGRPVYVAETRNATCLIRHAPMPERTGWPR